MSAYPSSKIKTITYSEFTERYNYIGKLGSGASGEVKLYLRTIDDVLVAIKSIYLHENEHRRQMIENEVAANRKMFEVIPNDVPEIYDDFIVEIDGISKLYIVMEHINGINLEKLLSEKLESVNYNMILDMSRWIFQCLDKIHHANLIHRDIKPANIIMLESKDGGNKFYLVDFGFTCSLNGTNDIVKCSSTATGTPLYMAPEILKRTLYLNKDYKATDIWAACMLIRELVHGKPLYDGDSLDKYITLISKFNNETYQPPFDLIIMEGLMQNPANRPTAGEMLEFVEKYGNTGIVAAEIKKTNRGKIMLTYRR